MSETWRSLLFVPANDEGRLQAAYSTSADGVVADLEDSVSAEFKLEARRVVADLIRTAPRGKRLVRINQVDSEHFADDLAAVAELPVDGLVVPKATAAAIERCEASGVPIIAVVESAAGVREAFDIASSRRVSRLILGAVDLSADLALQHRPDAFELLYARSKVVVDSRAAGIGPPIDRVFPDANNLLGAAEDATFARSLGFGGKACTDARHVELVNRVFGERR